MTTIDIPVNAAYVDFNCPSWCATDHVGHQELNHDFKALGLTDDEGTVPADVWLVQWFEESDDDGPRSVLAYGPPKLGVEACCDMTTEKARELAAMIVRLCDQAEGSL